MIEVIVHCNLKLTQETIDTMVEEAAEKGLSVVKLHTIGGVMYFAAAHTVIKNKKVTQVIIELCEEEDLESIAGSKKPIHNAFNPDMEIRDPRIIHEEDYIFLSSWIKLPRVR